MNMRITPKSIYIVSFILVIAVAVIYVTPKADIGRSLDFLPLLNACINGTVSALLVIGFILIRQKKIQAHRVVMTSSIVLSVLFLLSYVLYHTTHESTAYGGEGLLRSVYFFILISHIILAIVIVPLVLISFSRALVGQFERHRRIARITLPLWLYVSVTGVIVYLMIYPYYQ